MDSCLVYFSASVGQFSEADLTLILEQSHRNNSQSGVTGVMLYVRGHIVQVLEGDTAIVEALYQRIEQDRRHTNVTRVLTRSITERVFGNWAMGYETITARQLDDLKNVVNFDQRTGLAVAPGDHIILKTIQLFYESNRHN